MSAPQLISDDLRGVLEDIAAAPKQRLFAGSFFRQMGLAFRGEDATVGVARAGLSAAERHLVAMHRRELALTLQQAFYAQFFAPGGPAGLFFPRKEPMAKDEWEDQASGRCFVRLIHCQDWARLTGYSPPQPPLSAREYEAAGIPWFSEYSGGSILPGSGFVGRLKSFMGSAPPPFPMARSTTPRRVLDVATGHQVAEGEF